MTATIVFTGPPFALRSVSTPRDAADPVTSADFFSVPAGLMSPLSPKPFFFGVRPPAFSPPAGLALPPASPADPASTVAISVTGVAV